MQFEAEAAESDKNPLLLSITVPPFGENSYEIKKLKHLVDSVNLLMFNKHDFNHLKNFIPQKNSKTKRTFNLDVAANVEKWLKKGYPADKINLGVAVISRTYNFGPKLKEKKNEEDEL